MKPSLVSNAIKTLIKANRPVHLWGAPGVGKSQVVAQVATEMKLELRDVRAVLLDPVDLRGLPHVNGDDRAHWAIPEFLPRAGDGILFLDELNAAPQLVQAACYQLVLDRKIGEYVLPAGWRIIAAGNNQTDRAVVHAMPTPLKNRFVHLNFEIDSDDWCAWAVSAGVLPQVLAFIRFRPNLLHDFKPGDKDLKAFPTPRSWEFVSDILKADPDPIVEHELIAGTVGQGASVEFMGFLRMFRDLLSIDGILLDPQHADVPKQPAALYAVAAALATRTTPANFGRVLTYLGRLQKEFEVMAVRDAHRRDNSLQHTKEFTKWAIANHGVLI